MHAPLQTAVQEGRQRYSMARRWRQWDVGYHDDDPARRELARTDALGTTVRTSKSYILVDTYFAYVRPVALTYRTVEISRLLLALACFCGADKSSSSKLQHSCNNCKIVATQLQCNTVATGARLKIRAQNTPPITAEP